MCHLNVSGPITCRTENDVNYVSSANINHNWNSNDNRPAHFEPDTQSCWSFCQQTYSAPYFTWVKSDYSAPSWQTGCICKTGYADARQEAGFVSGPDCSSPASSTSSTTEATTTTTTTTITTTTTTPG